MAPKKPLKHKMDSEELAIHLHIQRKGGVRFQSKKDFKRHPKHKGSPAW